MTNTIKSFTNKNGALRLYDSTATPYYLEILFTGGDFTGPVGRPAVEEVLVLDRQNTTANMHYIEGSDARIMEPQGISFSGRAFDYAPCRFLLELLRGETTINSLTMVTTKGDTQNDSANANPAFADSSKTTYNVEMRFTGAGSGSYEHLKLTYNEVYFEPSEQSVNEGEDAVTINMSGQCYGTIVHATGAFTTGVDIASGY